MSLTPGIVTWLSVWKNCVPLAKLSSLLSFSVLKDHHQGVWGAHWIKPQTLAFCSWSQGLEFKPHIGLHAGCWTWSLLKKKKVRHLPQCLFLMNVCRVNTVFCSTTEMGTLFSWMHWDIFLCVEWPSCDVCGVFLVKLVGHFIPAGLRLTVTMTRPLLIGLPLSFLLLPRWLAVFFPFLSFFFNVAHFKKNSAYRLFFCCKKYIFIPEITLEPKWRKTYLL